MGARLLLFLITTFWVTMNVLLWRAEYGLSSALSSRVPVPTVWNRMLTAPDDSSLAVFHQGERIGFCRWSVNAGDELETGKISSEELLPEGMAEAVREYTVDLEGNAAIGDFANRLRFSLFAWFGTNHQWREIELKTSFRPVQIEIHAHALEERLSLNLEDGTQHLRKRYTFAELRQPQRLLLDLGGPAIAALGASVMPAVGATSLGVGLTWEAYQDWMELGHTRVRAYRLQTRVLDRYQATVFISRVGEILRVELPNDVVLVNDALVSFQGAR